MSLGKAESLANVASRMAAKDRLSFHVLSTSNDIRQGLLARGFKRPLQHHTGIQEQVMLFGNYDRQHGVGVTHALHQLRN